MGELVQTVSVIVPVHEKPPEVLRDVCQALGEQSADQVIIVSDRSSIESNLACAAQGLWNGWQQVMLKGPPGWRSPCIAFNAGLKDVTSDITVINHSDVVQAPGNIALVREWMQQKPAVYFAKVEESKPEECTGTGHAGPILCSSTSPRALTFLMAAPTQALRDIGGWDEAFQDGVCYEDDDLTARLWKHGLDFVFDDRFNAIHQSHSRAYFLPIRIAPNMAHMLRKHGSLTPYDREQTAGRLTMIKEQGRTTWSHA